MYSTGFSTFTKNTSASLTMGITSSSMPCDLAISNSSSDGWVTKIKSDRPSSKLLYASDVVLCTGGLPLPTSWLWSAAVRGIVAVEPSDLSQSASISLAVTPGMPVSEDVSGGVPVGGVPGGVVTGAPGVPCPDESGPGCVVSPFVTSAHEAIVIIKRVAESIAIIRLRIKNQLLACCRGRGSLKRRGERREERGELGDLGCGRSGRTLGIPQSIA
jgi:hypothetical protein